MSSNISFQEYLKQKKVAKDEFREYEYRIQELLDMQTADIEVVRVLFRTLKRNAARINELESAIDAQENADLEYI